jgi:hypothetical protein
MWLRLGRKEMHTEVWWGNLWQRKGMRWEDSIKMILSEIGHMD